MLKAIFSSKTIVAFAMCTAMLFAGLLAVAPSSLAIETGLNETANSAGFSTKGTPSITTIVGRVIQSVLSLVGVVFLVLLIYAGFRWMTAGGNKDAISEAKGMLTNAVIGLIIVLAAYSITNYVMSAVLMSTDLGSVN
jgi:hypothetical protein